MVADPASIGEREDQLPVEPARVPEVDVLDAGVVLEPGSSQPVGELSRVALGEFAVDEQPEPSSNERASTSLEASCSVKALAIPAHRSCWSLSTVG